MDDNQVTDYRQDNPVIYYALTGDPSRGGHFADDLSNLDEPHQDGNGSSGLTALFLALILLFAGIYQWFY